VTLMVSLASERLFYDHIGAARLERNIIVGTTRVSMLLNYPNSPSSTITSFRMKVSKSA
jgi:hypothetical protein